MGRFLRRGLTVLTGRSRDDLPTFLFLPESESAGQSATEVDSADAQPSLFAEGEGDGRWTAGLAVPQGGPDASRGSAEPWKGFEELDEQQPSQEPSSQEIPEQEIPERESPRLETPEQETLEGWQELLARWQGEHRDEPGSWREESGWRDEVRGSLAPERGERPAWWVGSDEGADDPHAVERSEEQRHPVQEPTEEASGTVDPAIADSGPGPGDAVAVTPPEGTGLRHLFQRVWQAGLGLAGAGGRRVLRELRRRAKAPPRTDETPLQEQPSPDREERGGQRLYRPTGMAIAATVFLLLVGLSTRWRSDSSQASELPPREAGPALSTTLEFQPLSFEEVLETGGMNEPLRDAPGDGDGTRAPPAPRTVALPVEPVVAGASVTEIARVVADLKTKLAQGMVLESLPLAPIPPVTGERLPYLSSQVYDISPRLKNVEEIQEELQRVYLRMGDRSTLTRTVVIWALIGEDGRVRHSQTVQSSGYRDLDFAALRVVEDMEFSPARQDGRNVASWVELPVTFHGQD